MLKVTLLLELRDRSLRDGQLVGLRESSLREDMMLSADIDIIKRVFIAEGTVAHKPSLTAIMVQVACRVRG